MKEDREISRTASYMVLSRHRGQSLYRDLLAARALIERLQRAGTSLAGRLGERENLLVLALHELAIEKEEEPHHFMRAWLADHRNNEGGEARSRA